MATSEKLNKLTGTDQKKTIELKSVNTEAENQMFSTVRTALNIDNECRKFCNMTQKQIIDEVSKLKRETKKQAEGRIIPFFKEAALSDIDLLFDTVMTALCCFTINEAYNVYQKILKRIEKILAENPKFYTMSVAEKNSIFTDQIIKFIPDWQMPFYSDLLTKEKENPFSLYNDFISKIQAQDFILRGSFINIQYDNNGNFMIINFPDFLLDINKHFIEHMIMSFTYGHSLKFGPANAILDMEDQGYRFNIIHNSLDVYKETSVFIRKNVSKPSANPGKLNFDFANYYYGLFSELPESEELAAKIIYRANKAKKKLEYKFEGFKSKDYVDDPYGIRWFMKHQKNLSDSDIEQCITMCDKILDKNNIKGESDLINQLRNEIYGEMEPRPYDREDVDALLEDVKKVPLLADAVEKAIGKRISNDDEMSRVVYVVKGVMIDLACKEIEKRMPSGGNSTDFGNKDLVSPMNIAKYGLIDVMKQTIQAKNCLVIGPTGSGKSTLLAKCLSEKQMLNPEQNLLTIEDTAELNIPNAIAYITNNKYKIHDIFVSTLRQNPSRVIIGETRGPEIKDILETCLTAKSGTTIHATNFDKMCTRLCMMINGEMSNNDLFTLVASAIDVCVFIIARKVTGVYIRNNKPFKENLEQCYDRII